MIYRLPSFFVVGAQKAGTTALHNWLNRQSDVCLPRIKETHYFSNDDRYKYGIDWYIAQFPKCNDKTIMGEVDPNYMFSNSAPLRISKIIKSPKLIFIFRNPIERAYSQYLMNIYRGIENLPFKEALLMEKERLAKDNNHPNSDSFNYYSYMARGCYSEQVMRFRGIFTDSEYLFIKFDDLIRIETSKKTYTKICKFLGLQTEPICPDILQKRNQASQSRSIFLRNIIYGQSKIKKCVGSLIPSKGIKLRVGLFLDRINQTPIKSKNNDWRKSVPFEIRRVADKEILEIENLTGLNLKDWIYESGPEGVS